MIYFENRDLKKERKKEREMMLAAVKYWKTLGRIQIGEWKGLGI